MSNKKINETVGEPFEELQIAEMTELQGAGDVEVETTPIAISGAVVSAAVGSCAGTIEIVKTCKGHC